MEAAIRRHGPLTQASPGASSARQPLWARDRLAVSPARGTRGVAAKRPATPRGVAGPGKFARQAVAASSRAP